MRRTPPAAERAPNGLVSGADYSVVGRKIRNFGEKIVIAEFSGARLACARAVVRKKEPTDGIENQSARRLKSPQMGRPGRAVAASVIGLRGADTGAGVYGQRIGL